MMANKKLVFGSLLVLSGIFLNSCGTSKVSIESFKNSYCMSENPYHDDNFVMDTLDYEYIKRSSLSKQDVLLCKILDISRDVNGLLILKEDNNETNQFINLQKELRLKQEISQKISLAKVELDAFISELDCEGERADLAGGYLDEINGGKNTQLTVGSVIVGALTTVATAIIKNDDVEMGVGIGGGLLSAGLGALTIDPKGKRIEFYHPKNILLPIWTNINGEYDFPNLIWNIFQMEEFSNDKRFSLLESTKERWMRFVLKGDIDSKEEALFFGKGGEYNAEQLHLRSEMTDQVKSSARYINQLLSIFESNLYKVVY